jgi:hypothetical protein
MHLGHHTGDRVSLAIGGFVKVLASRVCLSAVATLGCARGWWHEPVPNAPSLRGALRVEV